MTKRPPAVMKVPSCLHPQSVDLENTHMKKVFLYFTPLNESVEAGTSSLAARFLFVAII